MKKAILVLAIFMIGIITVFAEESHDREIEQGKILVESKISCDQLNDEQLETIGEYYMEQMHPGEAHEIMDNMMGGEGSVSLKQVHINMAKRLYCNDDVYIGYGMMGRGMMGGYPANYDYTDYGYSTIFWIMLLIVVIALFVWVILKMGIKNKYSGSPLNILRNRLARGEITKKEFEEIKNNLRE